MESKGAWAINLSDLASIGSLISGLAVLISLLYLNVQTRQSTKHTRALIFQGSAELALAQSQAMADPEIAAAIIVANGGTPTPEEIRRYQFIQVGVITSVVWDNFFGQHAEGLFDDEHFRRIRWYFVQQLRANPGLRTHFRQFLASPGAPKERIPRFRSWRHRRIRGAAGANETGRVTGVIAAQEGRPSCADGAVFPPRRDFMAPAASGWRSRRSSQRPDLCCPVR